MLHLLVCSSKSTYGPLKPSKSPSTRSRQPAGGPKKRSNINIQFLLLIVIQMISPLSPLPRSTRSLDGWMDRWIVEGRQLRFLLSAAAAVRFFIVSHKMPRIPEDCKYLEVFRSGKELGGGGLPSLGGQVAAAVGPPVSPQMVALVRGRSRAMPPPQREEYLCHKTRRR